MLSDRRQRILSALIEEYVHHALPVGSRTIAEQYQLGVSSATIRNELSVLEEGGYITQPHTSAGRIPTDAGYRQFVDGLFSSGLLSDEIVHHDLIARLRASADALDDLMERTSEELTNLTDCLSIVTAPSITAARVRQISLISLSNHQGLIVIVTQDGQVVNRTIAFSEEVGPERLLKIQHAMSDIFVGRRLQDIESEATLNAYGLANEPITSLILEEIISSLHDTGNTKTSRDGISSLMRMPEFHDSSSLLPIMEVLEDDTVLFRVFDDASAADSTLAIRIGQENGASNLAGVSVIAGRYGRGDAQGVVAVIGPKRMDYSKVICAVKAAQSALNER